MLLRSDLEFSGGLRKSSCICLFCNRPSSIILYLFILQPTIINFGKYRRRKNRGYRVTYYYFSMSTINFDEWSSGKLDWGFLLFFNNFNELSWVIKSILSYINSKKRNRKFSCAVWPRVLVLIKTCMRWPRVVVPRMAYSILIPLRV